MITNLSHDPLKHGSFSDADLSGMYRHKAMDDPVCSKSRIGYVIVVANCSSMWLFNMQSETTVSSVTADIVDLAHSCCKLFLIMDEVGILGIAIGLPVDNTTTQIMIYEDYVELLLRLKLYHHNSHLRENTPKL